MDTPVSNFAAYWNSRFLGVAMNDWLKYLRKQNDKSISFALRFPPEIRLISPAQIPQIVRHWCQTLGQPYSVHHRTLDIYEQFMMAHFTDLYRSTISSHDKRSKWQTIYANVKHQALLRLVSCFQIASKLEMNHKTVSCEQAAQLLRKARRPCDHSTILGSEITVLTTLVYQVNFPPTIEYIETILCYLVFANQKGPEDRLFVSVVDALHDVSKLLLDLVYHNRCSFFRHVFTFVCRTIHIRPEAREHVRKLQHDRMLLAAAIISGAGFIVEPRLQSYILEKVHEAVKIDMEDMSVMAAVVVSLLDRTV